MTAVSFLLASLLALLPVPEAAAQDEIFDFAISEEYLASLARESAAIVTLALMMTARTKSVHTLANDCGMHLAGNARGIQLSDPESIVVEPPNLCKFLPTASLGPTWPQVFDRKVMNRDCEVTGFPRIFTEHAHGGGEGGANPNG